MNLQEIKAAVNAGRVVHWSNPGYTVRVDKCDQWSIVHHQGHAIGLTWADGVTLNGKESEFYSMEFSIELNGACVLRTCNTEELARYLATNQLQAATSLDRIAQFESTALSADGDTVCGFIYCNKGV